MHRTNYDVTVTGPSFGAKDLPGTLDPNGSLVIHGLSGLVGNSDWTECGFQTVVEPGGLGIYAGTLRTADVAHDYYANYYFEAMLPEGRLIQHNLVLFGSVGGELLDLDGNPQDSTFTFTDWELQTEGRDRKKGCFKDGNDVSWSTQNCNPDEVALPGADRVWGLKSEN